MNFVHYRIFEEEEKYSSFVDLEQFEESDDDDIPGGFDKTEKGSAIDPAHEDRSRIRPWDSSENFFSWI